MRVENAKNLTAQCVAQSVLNEPWEYADADTQQLTHNIHRYSGKFIPQIAARAIGILTEPNELILDPYCGSGTSLLEAAVLGRQAIGIDLSPLATLIATTKVTPISSKQLFALQFQLSEWLGSFETHSQLDLFDLTPAAAEIKAAVTNDKRGADPWYMKWFHRDILYDLLLIDHAIQRLTDDRLRNVARVAFSDILRKSSQAHSGYPNVMFDKNAGKRKRPIKPFLVSLERIAEMVASLETSKADWNRIRVKLGNNTALTLKDHSVDAVISHPPYIGSIPYAEYGALSLKWLGFDAKILDKQLTGGNRQTADVVARFRSGYTQMLLESARVLRPGRYMFLMVGNPVVKGKKIDLAEMTVELAKAAGLRLVVQTTRKGVNRRANKMGDEHLLFFQNRN